jgi:hypothetical protein
MVRENGHEIRKSFSSNRPQPKSAKKYTAADRITIVTFNKSSPRQTERLFTDCPAMHLPFMSVNLLLAKTKKIQPIPHRRSIAAFRVIANMPTWSKSNDPGAPPNRESL